MKSTVVRDIFLYKKKGKRYGYCVKITICLIGTHFEVRTRYTRT